MNGDTNPTGQADRYDALTQEAMQALEAGDFILAKSRFEEALHSATAQNEELGENSASLVLDRQVESYKNLGRVWQGLGDTAQAEQCYRQALSLNPNHWKTLANLANLLHDSNRLSEAVDYARQALSFNPYDAVLLSNLGLYLAETGVEQDAESHFQKAIALNPQYMGATYNYALLLVKQQRWPEAVILLERVAENPPENTAIEVHRQLGEIYLTLKEQARQAGQMPSPDITGRFVYHFGKVLALRETSPLPEVIWVDYLYFIYFQLGVAFVDLGAHTQAAERFQAALAINPNENRVYIHHALAYAYFYLERYEEAEEHIVRFLQVEAEQRQPIFSLLLALLEKRGGFSRKEEMGVLLKGVDWEIVRQNLAQELQQNNLSENTPVKQTPTAIDLGLELSDPATPLSNLPKTLNANISSATHTGYVSRSESMPSIRKPQANVGQAKSVTHPSQKSPVQSQFRFPLGLAKMAIDGELISDADNSDLKDTEKIPLGIAKMAIEGRQTNFIGLSESSNNETAPIHSEGTSQAESIPMGGIARQAIERHL